MKKFTKIIVLAMVLSFAIPVVIQAQPPVYGIGKWYKDAGNNVWKFIVSFGTALSGW